MRNSQNLPRLLCFGTIVPKHTLNPTQTCELKIYDPDLGEIKTQQLDGTPGQHTVDVTFSIPKGGPYWFTTYATDSNRNNKCHRNSPSWVDGLKVCVPDITFLQPTGVVGGKVGVQVQVKMAVDFDAPPAMSEHEDTELHPWEWTSDNFDTYGMTSDSTITGTVKTTVYTIPWDTTQVHNGSHILRAKCIGDVEIVKEYSVEVKNLTVEGSPEVLIWDRQSEPNLQIKLEDAVPEDTLVQVSMYDSDQNLLRTDQLTLGVGDHQYTWVGKDAYGQVLPEGVYLYRLEASQPSQGDYDSDTGGVVQSTNLNVPDECPEEGLPMLMFDFSISTPASGARLDVYHPNLSIMTSQNWVDPLPIPTGQANAFPPFGCDLCSLDAGTVVFLVTPYADELSTDRAHRNRRMLQRNRRHHKVKHIVVLDPGHGIGYDGQRGAEGYDPNDSIDEESVVLNVSNQTKSILTSRFRKSTKASMEVRLTRTGTNGPSKRWRVDFVNKANDDMMRANCISDDGQPNMSFPIPPFCGNVSVHCSIRNLPFIYYPGHSALLANYVCPEFSSDGGIPFVGHYFLKSVGDGEFFLCTPRVKPPSICAEIAAIGKPGYMAAWEQWTGQSTNQSALATHIADGICQLAGK